MSLDMRAITLSLFLPVLYWTGAVIATSLVGYPGIVCMTPMAWLLALPVGLRMTQESQNPRARLTAEAAAAGAVLGLWEGLLAAVVLSYAPQTMPEANAGNPSPLVTALIAVLISIPVTAGLAAAIVWIKMRPR